jgi:BirA family biotin operon repressor/biotin-[acetyl-CoA-carboxylase] ligase
MAGLDPAIHVFDATSLQDVDGREERGRDRARAMTFALGPQAAEAGYRVIAHDSLDSTSSEAMRLARTGQTGPVWVVAREQTAGRGRRGRVWVTIPGNLAASLLISEAIAPAEAARLSFVAALAAHETCRMLAPGIELTLKWPNDLLANGRKVGGLLLESEARGGTLAVAIGFGLNLTGAPAGLAVPATSLAELGYPVAAEPAFALLTDAWHRQATLWRSRGFSDVRQNWLARAAGIGRQVSVTAGNRVASGIFETLDEEGRLVLRVADGATRSFSAGDVYFGDAATAGAAS